MTTAIRTVLVCDMCGTSDDDYDQATEFGGIKTHQLTIDDHSVELEACGRCWRQDVVRVTGMVIRRARPVPRRRRKTEPEPPPPATFPGQPWHFTFHALIRMGERHLQPGDVVTAVERPETVYTGDDIGTEVRIRGDIKVVVNVARRSILTCARRNEEMEGVA